MIEFLFLSCLLFGWGVLHRVLLVVGWCQVMYSCGFLGGSSHYLILPSVRRSLVVYSLGVNAPTPKAQGLISVWKKVLEWHATMCQKAVWMWWQSPLLAPVCELTSEMLQQSWTLLAWPQFSSLVYLKLAGRWSRCWLPWIVWVWDDGTLPSGVHFLPTHTGLFSQQILHPGWPDSYSCDGM